MTQKDSTVAKHHDQIPTNQLHDSACYKNAQRSAVGIRSAMIRSLNEDLHLALPVLPTYLP